MTLEDAAALAERIEAAALLKLPAIVAVNPTLRELVRREAAAAAMRRLRELES